MSIDNPLNRSDEGSITLGPPAVGKQVSMTQRRGGRSVTWREENAAAIKAYNEHIDRHGTFSESVRKF